MKLRIDETTAQTNSRNNGTHRTHFTHLITSQKSAFTLAETLITLAIIGIVAAITVPSLIQSYKKKEYSTKLKKFYSTMQQAVQMSQIDNGLIENWDFQMNIKDEEGNYDYNANMKYEKEWLNKYILPYIKYNRITDGLYIPPENEEDEGVYEPVTIYMNDGSTIVIWLGSCMDLSYDVNGESMPNTGGRDKYRFTFCFGASGAEYKNSLGFKPYLLGSVTSREAARSRCITNPEGFCSTLLWYDGWEFKDDYPYKL